LLSRRSHLQKHATSCSGRPFPAPPVTTAFHTGMICKCKPACKCIVLSFFF
jgi:hypothetical protein